MPNAAANLARSLLARYASLAPDERAALIALGGSDDAFLVPPPPPASASSSGTSSTGTSFDAAWPPGGLVDLSTVGGGLESALNDLANAARELDPRVQRRADRLVPRKVGESDFWRNYVGRAAAALGLPDAAAEDADDGPTTSTEGGPEDYVKFGLPPPRPRGERRYAPGLPLRVTGDVAAEELRSFVTRATAMVRSEDTVAHVSAAFERGSVPAASLELLQSQLELMEWGGIDRRLGCKQLEGAPRRFPKDEKLHKGIRAFQAACQRAVQGAVQRAAERPDPDPSKRRFKPAATLRSEGDVPLEDLTSIVNDMSAWMASDETRSRLADAARGGSHAAAALARDQRAYLEHRGLAQDFGMRAVGDVPARCSGEEKAGGKGSAAAALRAAHRRLTELNERVPREALIDASRPEARPAGERRFAPAPGPLARSGELSRDVALRFLREAGAMVTSPETVALLAAADPKRAPALSMGWQREMLEHLGVEQDFGCRELSAIPRRFGGDEEVLGAFVEFQKSCVLGQKMAVEGRRATGVGASVEKLSIQ